MASICIKSKAHLLVQLTVSIELCQSGLTKIVSFAPFYLVSNCGKFDMEVLFYSGISFITVLFRYKKTDLTSG